MKKLLSLFVFVFVTSSMSFLHAQAFQGGKNYLSLGYGVGTLTGSVFSVYEGYADYSNKAVGPFYVKYGFAVSEKVEFGVNFAYGTNKITFEEYDGVTTTINRSSWSALASLKTHFGDHPRFDPYWSIGLGYRTANWKFSYSDPNYSGNEEYDSVIPLGFETTFGARYYITEAIAAYGEIGLAKSYFQGGVTVKL